MDCADPRRSSRLRRLRRLIAGLCLAGWPLAGPGCAVQDHVASYPAVPPPLQAAAPAPQTAVQPVEHTEPADHPPVAVDHAEHAPAVAAVPQEVPITLDAVLRIAEQSN